MKTLVFAVVAAVVLALAVPAGAVEYMTAPPESDFSGISSECVVTDGDPIGCAPDEVDKTCNIASHGTVVNCRTVDYRDGTEQVLADVSYPFACDFAGEDEKLAYQSCKMMGIGLMAEILDIFKTDEATAMARYGTLWMQVQNFAAYRLGDAQMEAERIRFIDRAIQVGTMLGVEDYESLMQMQDEGDEESAKIGFRTF